MIRTKTYSSIGPILYLDLLFASLLFLVPLVNYSFIYNPKKDGTELYIVTVVAIWAVFKGFLLKKSDILNIKSIDIILLIFLIYNLVNFHTLSLFGYRYNMLWVFFGYFFLIFFYRHSLHMLHKAGKKNLFTYYLVIVISVAFIESIIALLQYFDFWVVESPFFNMLGTFINPNFLGVYMGLGCLTIIHLMRKSNLSQRIFFIVLLFVLFPILTALYLSESRTTWVALIGSLLFYFLLNFKNIKYILGLSLRFKIALASFLLILCISGLMLVTHYGEGSIRGRALILKIASQSIMDKPLIGHGLFNFSSYYNDAKATYFLSENKAWEEIEVANIVSVAFNDFVHIWFELGIFGLIPLIILLILLIKNFAFSQRNRLAASIFVYALILSTFTSVLYNPSLMVILCWSFGVLTVSKGEKHFFSVPSITLKYPLIITGFIGLGFFLIKTYSLTEFRRTMEYSKNHRKKLSPNNIYGSLKPNLENPYLEFRLGHIYFINGSENRGLNLMNSAVRKIPNVELNRVLSELYENMGNLKSAENCLKKNIGLEPYVLGNRVTLMDFYGRHGEATKQKKIAKEIVELPIKIPSKEASFYKNKASEIYLQK